MRLFPTFIWVVLCVCPATVCGVTLTGTVRVDGSPVAGVFATARDSTRGVSFSAMTDADGRYQLEVAPGAWMLSAHGRGWNARTRRVQAPSENDLSITAAPADAGSLAPHDFLSLLPGGEEKRRFVVDCMGCHSLNRRIVFDTNGSPWDEKGWTTATEKMITFAGPKSGFPILPPDRKAAPTAAFAAQYLTASAIRNAAASGNSAVVPATRYEVTEFDLPDQNDFPHDLMRDGRGHMLITGMFSGQIYVLDPVSARFETVKIPIEHANPRALDVDTKGNWWVLCGFPHKIARRNAGNARWDFFDIGVYGHSVGVDLAGRAWFNGHFTRDPVVFGYVDPGTGKSRTLEAPATPMPAEQGGPIPYELRIGYDGIVWITELAGNRLIRHNPSTGETKAHALPSPHSGPRRCDVAPDGAVWVPEFAGNRLARFNPALDAFEEFDLPVGDALPYCVRVDARRGWVWMSLCAADALARFDPRTERFELFPLPTRNAYIRHLDIDPETGEVWGAYSHSPNLEMRIVRVRVTG